MRYRISKYHPYFSKHVDDWTSITDVGDERYGLTIGDYRQYEDKYIESVLILIGSDNDNEIKITDFESSPQWDHEKAEKYKLEESVFKLYQKDYKKEVYLELYSGKRVFKYCELPFLLKILLRDEAWFIISVGGYKIDVGFDYYIHIDSPENLTEKAGLLPQGIYLENF